MTTAHRSLDGTQMHAGYIEVCPACTPHTSMKHDPDEHHGFIDCSMFGPFSGQFCVCGEKETHDVHSAPYCNDCVVPEPEKPGPWWRRLWHRFAAWWLPRMK